MLKTKPAVFTQAKLPMKSIQILEYNGKLCSSFTGMDPEFKGTYCPQL